METISDKEIKNLPVYGKSNSKIGRVIGFDLDSESQSVIRYHVKPQQVIKNIFRGNLIISREQVIEINKEKMIVDDSVEQVSEKKVEIAGSVS
jgi:sporulation protein YlmC with PRC-barrel domain